ncbi:hypothetical protein SynA1562_01586 [Synechococcus sp. A15-62]|nr:hypothetical protein SynA1562_01586 [Synechococcus sp. A15-62]
MNLTIDGSIGAKKSIKTVIYRITTADPFSLQVRRREKKIATTKPGRSAKFCGLNHRESIALP